MSKNSLLVFLSLLILTSGKAQSSKLPVKEWTSAAQMPLVLYISGDGEVNDLRTAINKAEYSIAAVNARSYFWDAQIPAKTATDIETF